MPEPSFAGLQLEGTLSTEPAEIAYAAADFGGIVSRAPFAVARVSSARDVSAVFRFAAEHGLSVRPRGQGHTGMGQAQAASGIVLDLSGLNAVQDISDDRVVVGAGTTWAKLLTVTLQHGLTPRVLTDYLDLSVGGIGGTSHRYGVQTDNVLSLYVVTGDGILRTSSRRCSPGSAEAG